MKILEITKKNNLGILLLFVVNLITTAVLPSSSFALDEKTEAVNQLNKQITLLESIKDYVERKDNARLLVLQKSSQRVIDVITKSGVGHIATFRAYQELFISYEFSQSFFKQIQTDASKENIISLMQLNESIKKAKGFDETPYLTLIASMLLQINQLTDQLVQLPISNELKQKIHNLKPELGRAIAIARVDGDRPIPFELATGIARKIMTMYEDFNQIMSSNQAFDITLEIQGLNELLSDYAQIAEKDKKEGK